MLRILRISHIAITQSKDVQVREMRDTKLLEIKIETMVYKTGH